MLTSAYIQNQSMSSVLQAISYCELIRSINATYLTKTNKQTKKGKCGNGGIQSKGSVFLFLWNFSHGNTSTLCLCNSVNYMYTVTNTPEGWRI